MKKYLYKFISIIFILASFLIMFLGDFNEFSITIGTIVLILGFTLWIFSTPKAYNNAVSSVKQIPNDRNLTIEDFYHAFKDHNSILGKPWLGNLKTVKGKCLIFGPSESGDYLYMHRMFNNFYLSVNQFPSFIKNYDGRTHKFFDHAFSDEEIISYSLIGQSILEDVLYVFTEFSIKNIILPFQTENNIGKLYRFSEEFKLTGQTFYLSDFHGNQQYKIDATIPLKTFYITDINTGEEKLKLTKRLIKVLDHYDFYVDGNLYGSFEQKLDIYHDTFELQTTDGLFQMKSINDQFGTNYIVKLNDKVIGTIAEKLNITLNNLVFDNFVIHIRDQKYLVILAAFAVMAARELKRDNTN